MQQSFIFRCSLLAQVVAQSLLSRSVSGEEMPSPDCGFASYLEKAVPHRNIADLAAAYPEQHLKTLSDSIGWPDGTVMKLSYAPKSFQQALDSPNLGDQLAVPYPKFAHDYRPLVPNCDPGRIRFEPFFRKMYGDSALDVVRNLVKMEWLSGANSKTVLVSRVNGVDQNLKKISEEIDRLPADIKKSATRLGGSFYWRQVRGTNRRSPHSFGIAIDLDPSAGNYWRWDIERKGKMVYASKILMEIVDIFERHGFIWGGRWYHYDTMHFEYRPEMLIHLHNGDSSTTKE